MSKYAVMIEIDEGTPDYVREGNPWTTHSKVKVFNRKEEAQEEASKWNTGKVVLWK